MHLVFIKEYIETYAEIVKTLLSYGANPNILDEYGLTFLHRSAKNGYIEITKESSNKKANIQSRNKDSYTPLHFAVDAGHLEILKLLLSSGADVNTKNKYANTPLHIIKWRPENNYTQITKLLKHAGAKRIKIF